MSKPNSLSADAASPTAAAENAGFVSFAFRTKPATLSFTYDHHVAMRRLAISTTSSTASPSDAATTISKIMTALLVDAGATMRAPWRAVISIGSRNTTATGATC